MRSQLQSSVLGAVRLHLHFSPLSRTAQAAALDLAGSAPPPCARACCLHWACWLHLAQDSSRQVGCPQPAQASSPLRPSKPGMLLHADSAPCHLLWLAWQSIP